MGNAILFPKVVLPFYIPFSIASAFHFFYILLILSNQNKGKDKTVKIKEIEKPERMKLTAGPLKSSKRDKPDWLGKREETNFYVTIQLSF